MSRFANPAATREVDLGPCECPGTPHDHDTATIRTEASGSDLFAAEAVDRSDVEALCRVFARFMVGWTLLGPDGEEWPPSAEALGLLTAPNLIAISSAIRAVIREAGKVPNRSSAPSRASSPGSASPTQKPSQTPGT